MCSVTDIESVRTQVLDKLREGMGYPITEGSSEDPDPDHPLLLASEELPEVKGHLVNVSW